MLAKEWEYFDEFMEQCQTFLLHEMFFMSPEEFRELTGNSYLRVSPGGPTSNFNHSFSWSESGFIGVCFGVFSKVVILTPSGLDRAVAPEQVDQCGHRYLVPLWLHNLRVGVGWRYPSLPYILRGGGVTSWWQ